MDKNLAAGCLETSHNFLRKWQKESIQNLCLWNFAEIEIAPVHLQSTNREPLPFLARCGYHLSSCFGKIHRRHTWSISECALSRYDLFWQFYQDDLIVIHCVDFPLCFLKVHLWCLQHTCTLVVIHVHFVEHLHPSVRSTAHAVVVSFHQCHLLPCWCHWRLEVLLLLFSLPPWFSPCLSLLSSSLAVLQPQSQNRRHVQCLLQVKRAKAFSFWWVNSSILLPFRCSRQTCGEN